MRNDTLANDVRWPVWHRQENWDATQHLRQSREGGEIERRGQKKEVTGVRRRQGVRHWG